MRVLVFGELINDEFVYGNVRLSPEAPTCVLKPDHETTNPGGAGNLAANLFSLRPDWHIKHIHQSNVITKRRYVDQSSGYILLRVDENDVAAESLGRGQVDLLLSEKWDAIVISQYKNFVVKDIMQYIFERAKCPTFLDTKFQLCEWSRNCFCVKINKKEFEAQPEGAAGFCQNLVVTLGKDGAALFQEGREVFRDAGRPAAIRSLAGAGDSHLAGLVVDFLEKKDLRSAISYANLVSSVAVSKPGIVAVKQEELT